MSPLGASFTLIESFLQSIQPRRDRPQLRRKKVLQRLPSIFNRTHRKAPLKLIIARLFTPAKVHSYRSASAGSTFAALPLGYNVAIKLTPRLTVPTSTACQTFGANGR